MLAGKGETRRENPASMFLFNNIKHHLLHLNKFHIYTKIST